MVDSAKLILLNPESQVALLKYSLSSSLNDIRIYRRHIVMKTEIKFIRIKPGNECTWMIFKTGDKYNNVFPSKWFIEGGYLEGVYDKPNNAFIGGYYKILFSQEYKKNAIVETENLMTSLSCSGQCVGSIHDLDFAPTHNLNHANC